MASTLGSKGGRITKETKNCKKPTKGNNKIVSVVGNKSGVRSRGDKK